MRSAVLLVLLIASSLPASATTYLVRPDGTGDYPTIQAAIVAAATGDTVGVEPGTYTVTVSRGDESETIELEVRAAP